jgi:Holliday junction resolvase RusA-like endonuclease
MSAAAIKPPRAAHSADFFLCGRVPSKKNSKEIRQRGRAGAKFIATKEIYKSELTALTVRAREYWRTLPPLTDATLSFVFYVSSRAQDLDNALSGILDCLKDARVIVGDSMMHVHSFDSISYRLVKKGEEGVRVMIAGVEADRKC